MNKGIIVEMPQSVYVSFDSSKTLDSEFYFSIYKEFQKQQTKQNQGEKKILISPTISIKGFEKLLKINPEGDQEEQLLSAAVKFVESLVAGSTNNTTYSDWSASYVYYDETKSLDIVIKYAGDGLEQNFSIKFSTNKLICGAINTLNAINLIVHTEGFDNMFSEDESNYKNYTCIINAQYAPCITKFIATYRDVDYTKSLYINPSIKKSLTFSWEIAGNGKIDRSLQKGEEYIQNANNSTSIEDTVEKAAWYTLKASNQKGFIDRAQIEVKITNWSKVGKVTGLFNDSSNFDQEKNNRRLFFYKEKYYCYPGNVLYKSDDGCKWETCSCNTEKLDYEGIPNLVCGMYEDMFYVMAGGDLNSRLKIMRYDFLKNTWSSSSAYQNCISYNASLAFSRKFNYYSQTITDGIHSTGNESDWTRWNRENFEITLNWGTAICSDMCFWKDNFYAVILCDNGKFYLYRCDYDIEEALLVGELEEKLGKDERIFLLPTVNKLFIATKNTLFDTDSKTFIEDFLPSTVGTQWWGSNETGIFGIFSDQYFWIYKE